MKRLRNLSAIIFITVWSGVAIGANRLPDEPDTVRDRSVPYRAAESYKQALDAWKNAADINKWIANSFIYDRDRAVKLSASRKTKENAISIFEPAEFFEKKAGVCVDLARFGFETLRKINPNSDPKYLMIEFDPIQIKGNIFRLHWLVSFNHDGMKYFFCDSKRPGHIAGPYNSTEAFISEYEHYRGRKIVLYRELESYRKKKKSKMQKRRALKSHSKTNNTK